MARKKDDTEVQEHEPKTDLLEGEPKGVGPQEKNPRIEKAAKAYVKVRNERMVLTEKETNAKAVLSHEMHEAQVTRYVYTEDDKEMEVICEPGKEKLKVNQVGDDDE